ncbi:MAG: histidine phosphatase family protein [Actinobacteria bacterium]|nr:histidine phosphatase family protein [Actinomycetota bacterium]NIS34182.1 histidine phosphatase family protein [Actinomycetota bacterium]NIU20974.1 histidine phosphatase family protein [Actinomycetota bacterium]NIU68960.1 histidine phosphatase family protein [Actinomycetota bacterium]NIV89014.1 histidine phosphatase family protein [Actinomycetota bacterium]
MLARLLLVRHGEVLNPDHVVYADLPGFGLSNRGRAQAEETAEHLATSGAAVVVSSPLLRAVQTAAPIADRLGVDVETDERLVEWRLSNRWAGVVWEDVDRVFPGELSAYLDRPHALPFSPEPIQAAAARVIAVVDDLGRRHPGETAVVVGHQDPTQAARLLLRGLDIATLHSDKPDHGTVVDLAAGSPWVESGRWDPPSAASPFPPVGAERPNDA